jgi:diadenosine tetraphosphate (Ap4A) HIT family hydrolase
VAHRGRAGPKVHPELAARRSDIDADGPAREVRPRGLTRAGSRVRGGVSRSRDKISGAMSRDLGRDPSCGICASLDRSEPIWADDLWLVRPIEAPVGVAGWMVMVGRRHCPGPAQFDDAEALSFGPALRHLEATLLRVTGAERIYTAALGEAQRHFHCHMVPRYAAMPKGASGWAVFDLQRAAREGEVAVDPAEEARVERAYAEALRLEPPPGRS